MLGYCCTIRRMCLIISLAAISSAAVLHSEPNYRVQNIENVQIAVSQALEQEGSDKQKRKKGFTATMPLEHRQVTVMCDGEERSEKENTERKVRKIRWRGVRRRRCREG